MDVRKLRFGLILLVSCPWKSCHWYFHISKKNAEKTNEPQSQVHMSLHWGAPEGLVLKLTGMAPPEELAPAPPEFLTQEAFPIGSSVPLMLLAQRWQVWAWSLDTFEVSRSQLELLLLRRQPFTNPNLYDSVKKLLTVDPNHSDFYVLH